MAKSYPVELFWVLGGSINREIYVGQLRKEKPNIPILISQGSQEPCILLIFQHFKVALDHVWLEKCGQDTFANFYFGLPFLTKWGIHKVKLITSQSHLPRAKLMAQIILNFHGIALEVEVVPEKGVPGNREFPLKTALDVTRILLWTPLSQIISPQCKKVTELIDVNLNDWYEKRFGCESQVKFKIPKF
jgi:uncharacterized SAM-binding protein YcdF (DUF218 family)